MFHPNSYNKIISRNADQFNSIIIDNYNKLDEIKYPEVYTQLSIISYFNKKYILDLSKFTSLQYLYICNANELELDNIPDTLLGIHIRLSFKNIIIPYKNTIKNIFRGSSMGEDFIDLTDIYHTDKHNFNYLKSIEFYDNRKYN